MPDRRGLVCGAGGGGMRGAGGGGGGGAWEKRTWRGCSGGVNHMEGRFTA